MSDEMQFLVGSTCARIYNYASDRAWYKLFKPTEQCDSVFREMQTLSNDRQHGLALVRLFKGIEAEIDRLVEDTAIQNADRMITELKRRELISEWEFHFLNGLRALRNEFGHGRAEQPNEEELKVLYSLCDVALLLGTFLLAKLNATGR